jgi:hypothetical protein
MSVESQLQEVGMMERDFFAVQQRLATSLRRDAALHQLGRHAQLGQGYTELRAALPAPRTERTQRLRIALDFWEAWQLARDSDWRGFDHVPAGLWPELGLVVAGDLEADRDITDPRVRLAYDLSMTFQLPAGLAASLVRAGDFDETLPSYAEAG